MVLTWMAVVHLWLLRGNKCGASSATSWQWIVVSPCSSLIETSIQNYSEIWRIEKLSFDKQQIFLNRFYKCSNTEKWITSSVYNFGKLILIFKQVNKLESVNKLLILKVNPQSSILFSVNKWVKKGRGNTFPVRKSVELSSS